MPGLTIFFGLSMHEAIATSLSIIVPTTLFGAVLHMKFDNIGIRAVRVLIPAALIGAICGAVTSSNIPGDILRAIFGSIMIVSSLRIAFSDRPFFRSLK